MIFRLKRTLDKCRSTLTTLDKTTAVACRLSRVDRVVRVHEANSFSQKNAGFLLYLFPPPPPSMTTLTTLDNPHPTAVFRGQGSAALP